MLYWIWTYLDGKIFNPLTTVLNRYRVVVRQISLQKFYISDFSAKISDFGENLGLRRKSRTSPKISDFGENLGFGRKSRILAKILNFSENLGFRRKSRIWGRKWAQDGKQSLGTSG